MAAPTCGHPPVATPLYERLQQSAEDSAYVLERPRRAYERLFGRSLSRGFGSAYAFDDDLGPRRSIASPTTQRKQTGSHGRRPALGMTEKRGLS